jgi:SpoVK/Ycf46/Vps4 family AAA+-type ATPase
MARFDTPTPSHTHDLIRKKSSAMKELNSKELWKLDGFEVADSNQEAVLRHKFLSQIDGEAITIEREFTLTGVDALDVATEVARILDAPVTGDTNNEYVVCGNSHSNGPVLVTIEKKSEYEHTDGANIVHYGTIQIKLFLTGNRYALELIMNILRAKFVAADIGKIRWWYKGSHGNEKTIVFLHQLKTKLHAEFYPGMGDPHEYLQSYLDSEQAVLLIAGSPGTAKTTLLRHLIMDYKLQADVVYDEGLMDKDQVFQDFLFSQSTLLIIEDADSILLPRESNNSMMARFLNISDGIIKLPKKKLVFTTNISDFSKIDEALIRPGRCFDRLETKALTYEEAIQACKVADLPVPLIDKSYTLAQLWNQDVGDRVIRRVGFGT